MPGEGAERRGSLDRRAGESQAVRSDKTPQPARGAPSGGFVLVLVLLLLAIGTAVAMVALYSATTEVNIEGNRAGGLEAYYAADAGLAQAVVTLRGDPPPPGTRSSGWRYPPEGFVTRDLPNGARVRWSARFKRDTDDLDRDRDRDEIVLFNRAFRYAGSNFLREGEGHPVIEIHSVGRFPAQSDGGGGEPQAERELTLELGRNRLLVAAHGAITARGPVAVLGGTVDGRNHAESGEPGGGCGGDLPGVFLESGAQVRVATGAALAGSPPWIENPVNGSVRARVVPDTPWDALGVAPGSLPTPLVPGSRIEQPAAGETLVVGGSWRLSPAVVSGVVIVHNPLFDARRWEYSNDPAADHRHPSYEARMDRSSPLYEERYAPARFSASTGVFRGVIVADVVDAIAGDAAIVGGVISLSASEQTVIGPGRPRVVASCDAVERAADRGYATRLGQR
jgi:hypothetical protein